MYGGGPGLFGAEETVEKHLFDALTKTCLIEDRQSSNYTRCGRTDKGVSAMSQIIALRVRSNIPKDAATVPHHPCDTVEVTVPRTVTKVVDGKKVVETEMVTEQRREYDYCNMLNSVLPPDIRVLGWTEGALLLLTPFFPIPGRLPC
jgi:tRNA pseudouridine38/39 synthase